MGTNANIAKFPFPVSFPKEFSNTRLDFLTSIPEVTNIPNFINVPSTFWSCPVLHHLPPPDVPCYLKF